MHDAQAEGSSDGSIHTRALLAEHVEAQRGAVRHVCHHCSLIEYLPFFLKDK